MTDFQRQQAGTPYLPDAVSQLQNSVESLFLSKKALEQQVAALRATQPVLMMRPPRPGLVKRVALRLSGRLSRRYHLQLIRQSGLFDPRWYLQTYSDVAASGGYWLACAAEEIYAQDVSVIGSVGVISSGFGWEI